MDLASAYPDSAISAGAMTAIAVVMVAVLSFWLIMVYVADRQGAKENARKADGHLTPVAGKDEVADEQGGGGTATAGQRRGAAA